MTVFYNRSGRSEYYAKGIFEVITGLTRFLNVKTKIIQL